MTDHEQSMSVKDKLLLAPRVVRDFGKLALIAVAWTGDAALNCWGDDPKEDAEIRSTIWDRMNEV